MKKRFIIFGLSGVLVAGLSGGVVWWLGHRGPFPADIRANAGIQLYYPTKVPAGFKINPTSFSQKGGVVLYSFNTPDGDKLNFTIEKAPSDYDYNELYGTTMENTKTVATALGTAHIGNLGENTMASIVTGGTWVLAVYSQVGANDDLSGIMKSLKRY